MDELAQRFRRGAQARTGLRYPAELRQLAAQYCELARARGESWQQIAEALEVCAATLVRWFEGCGAPASSGSLHEVVVVHPAVDRTPVLVMPSGVRVQGLSMAELVAVLEAVG
jgi:hypothetical protein